MRSTIRIAGTNPQALTDGPGMRFSVYVQGCSIHCPGCQVPHLHDPGGGDLVPVDDLVGRVLASGLPVSILGGEPLDQIDGVSNLVHKIKTMSDARPHVIVYTGRTFEWIIRHLYQDDGFYFLLCNADVLVDGPFVQAQDHDRLQYRGSANQRVIDLKATMQKWRRSGHTTALSRFKPILLDWDAPEIIITPEGDLLAAEGLAAEFAVLGDETPARRCGEVKV
jgi:anaerobic ribonucleoside-triphosphate reductase activating protein